LSVSLDNYAGLPQGPGDFCATQTAGPGPDDQPLGWLLLLDTRDKSAQLKNQSGRSAQEWVDAGKMIKTEKIRDLDFAVLPMSSNDVPKTLQKIYPAVLRGAGTAG